eukprot:CAMPEP_0203672830 /NCGR_PEP_ID=MMETSP0090-20130426/9575_1 /ASSEMBLY_ACC=CAM_ASM_001088 /TAXON_ID=426623 /ORGANISM="Chaetoceros affinis, Strain CCMP159" /LENGTH=239 /DNA_ID=CAMNT_0050538257 /DNA_START=45 /DNA_END=767 /DNA_ORIENTATION=-
MSKKQKKNSKKSSKKASSCSNEEGGFINIDPERIRFQHSRIRPHFSGCGRSVLSTLDAIRNGTLSPDELPHIQVIVGPDENDGKGPWYFSLNNRRLWVLKRCREEGLLENNMIKVRVRQPKSINEFERYSIENCAVEAKFMREKETKQKQEVKIEDEGEKDNTCISRIEEENSVSQKKSVAMQNISIDKNDDLPVNQKNDANDSIHSTESEESNHGTYANRFCFDEDSSDSSDNENSMT